MSNLNFVALLPFLHAYLLSPRHVYSVTFSQISAKYKWVTIFLIVLGIKFCSLFLLSLALLVRLGRERAVLTTAWLRNAFCWRFVMPVCWTPFPVFFSTWTHGLSLVAPLTPRSAWQLGNNSRFRCVFSSQLQIFVNCQLIVNTAVCCLCLVSFILHSSFNQAARYMYSLGPKFGKFSESIKI